MGRKNSKKKQRRKRKATSPGKTLKGVLDITRQGWDL